MPNTDSDQEIFARWEHAVEFRLFADTAGPTLTVPEQVAAKLGDRIISGQLQPGARIGEQELADEFAILSRSYFAKLVPKENANEYFGFYNILGKFAAIMGPALYALTSQLTGDSRNGLASISLLFIIGGVLMLRTEDN